MKTIKMFQAVLVILVLSILVGCSDQITAPTNQVPAPGGSGKQNTKVSQTQELLSINSFSTQIRLKPYRTYIFNVSNTGLAKFTAIDIENLSIDPNEDKLVIDCSDLAIYGYGGIKYDLALSCHSKGFDVNQIAVENLSSEMVDLNVSLYGVKSKKAAIE